MIRGRIFERGVGETPSSGTGATGAVIAHCHDTPAGRWPREVTVTLDGGQLEVEVAEDLRVDLQAGRARSSRARISDEVRKGAE